MAGCCHDAQPRAGRRRTAPSRVEHPVRRIARRRPSSRSHHESAAPRPPGPSVRRRLPVFAIPRRGSWPRSSRADSRQPPWVDSPSCPGLKQPKNWPNWPRASWVWRRSWGRGRRTSPCLPPRPSPAGPAISIATSWENMDWGCRDDEIFKADDVFKADVCPYLSWLRRDNSRGPQGRTTRRSGSRTKQDRNETERSN